MNLRPRRRPVPIIPIVSMIDIMVVLLIFFIATTTFRQDKMHVDIALPESKAMGEADAQPEARTAITVSKDQKLFLGGEPVTAQTLAGALTALKKSKPDAKLELEADTTTDLGVLFKVWDALRAAGYSVNDVPARVERPADSAP